MEAVAAAKDPMYVVNTGDNFYWCGLQNSTDFQVGVDWLEPFSIGALGNLTWYNSLGNHEYGYNVDAQLDLAKLFARRAETFFLSRESPIWRSLPAAPALDGRSASAPRRRRDPPR